jgi:hypothetical protein
MTGLSLSYCIADILDGERKESDLDVLVAGTRCPDEAAFARALSQYVHTGYWKSDPVRAMGIAWRLWDEGRIIQPRVIDNSIEMSIAKGWWVTSDCRVHRR